MDESSEERDTQEQTHNNEGAGDHTTSASRLAGGTGSGSGEEWLQKWERGDWNGVLIAMETDPGLIGPNNWRPDPKAIVPDFEGQPTKYPTVTNLLDVWEAAGVTWKLRRRVEGRIDSTLSGKPLEDANEACTEGDWSAFARDMRDTPTLKYAAIRAFRLNAMKTVPEDPEGRERLVLEHAVLWYIKLEVWKKEVEDLKRNPYIQGSSGTAPIKPEPTSPLMPSQSTGIVPDPSPAEGLAPNASEEVKMRRRRRKRL